MTDKSARRRAILFRQRARQLAETAAREPHDDRRRYMLDVAASYERTADQMAPPPSGQDKARP